MSVARDPGENNGLQLVLFSVGEVNFGVYACQIAGTSNLRCEGGEEPIWLHELLEFGERPIISKEPVILDVWTAGDLVRRVAVDAMEDVVSVRVDDIFPLPPEVEHHALRKGMWGVLLREGRMILLMDFMLLLNDRECPC